LDAAPGAGGAPLPVAAAPRRWPVGVGGEGATTITHHVGGPVGQQLGATDPSAPARRRGGGRGGGRGETVVLHHVPGVPGAVALLGPAAAPAAAAAAAEPPATAGRGRPARWAAAVRGRLAAAARRLRLCGGPAAEGGAAAAAAAGAAAEQQQQQQRRSVAAAALRALRLYHGGSFEDLLRRVAPTDAAVKPAAGAAAPAAAAASPLAPALQRVRVYHGVCAWAAGQLEGELRSGMWGLLRQASVGDVVATPPRQLWRRLTEGGRALEWL
jgi:hypothetical protein